MFSNRLCSSEHMILHSKYYPLRKDRICDRKSCCQIALDHICWLRLNQFVDQRSTCSMIGNIELHKWENWHLSELLCNNLYSQLSQKYNARFCKRHKWASSCTRVGAHAVLRGDELLIMEPGRLEQLKLKRQEKE